MSGVEAKLLGTGFYWQDLGVGDRFRTYGRTIRDADIVAFTSLVGMTEPLFTDDTYRQAHSAISGRVAPGALVYSVAEGLVLAATAHGTGLAFLNATIDVLGPTVAGDTVHVEFEVIEIRPARKHGRGLVRTANRIVNQHGETVATYDPLRLMAGRSGGS
jgi:acyl dehydratase